MSRSSIFSFDTLHLGGDKPRGLLFALTILLLFEFAVARQDWLWTVVPRSETGVAFAMEKDVIDKAADPRIIFMGSSRVRDAIAPRQLESELGLPTGSVLNLALTGGTSLDALRQYRRHREKFSQARLVVLSIETWQFAEGLPPSSRDRCFGSLSDRLKWFKGSERLSLLVGFVWRTFDARVQIKGVLLAPLLGKTGDLPIADDGRVVWRKKEMDEGPEQITFAHRLRGQFGGFKLGHRQVAALEECISLIRKDGPEVMVFHPPLRDAYIAAWKAEYPEAYATVHQAIDAMDNVSLRYFEKASEVGIPDKYFYDYCHLTRFGTKIMTARMAEIIREEYGSRLNEWAKTGS
ncbi:MAG: SGNH/GDSL hydrolase family protein [Planctomycetes bacterium]|nr:SGNH/GDSL hydrolase family protein [Planctomycetota bacterium]